jgi:hypothetical protein
VAEFAEIGAGLLMIAGLASAPPRTLTSGLAQHGVSH